MTGSERTIFLDALDRIDPAERAAYLDRACGDKAELRRRVERLLQAVDQAGSFMDEPAIGEGTLAAVGQGGSLLNPGRAVQEGPGTRIGPYKLLEPIGEGGMGVVYMAEQVRAGPPQGRAQDHQAGDGYAQVIARFEAERQALAMMDHPNIASVLDAGTTDTGRPYFVMELVKGSPITEFCDRNGLSLDERLELFAPVCRAIQHAHQRGVIHRDVKPSNVLVTLYDGKPVPKVIDFGVAKAIDQQLTERTLFTRFGVVVGTLEYMSPEQAELGALEVDTRSDVYSLGVLLYELLDGQHAAGAGPAAADSAYADALRRIREEEPPRPSAAALGDPRDPAGDLVAAPGRSHPAGEGRAWGARLDRDEGIGEGPGAAIRLGRRPGPRRRALPPPRGRRGRATIGRLSDAEMDEEAFPGPSGLGRRFDPRVAAGARRVRHDGAAGPSPEAGSHGRGDAGAGPDGTGSRRGGCAGPGGAGQGQGRGGAAKGKRGDESRPEEVSRHIEIRLPRVMSRNPQTARDKDRSETGDYDPGR